jgi:hypothetical protein
LKPELFTPKDMAVIDLDLADDEAEVVSIQSTDPFAKKNQAS